MKVSAYSGLVISVIGAALDFSSGYSFLQPGDGMMTAGSNFALALGLFALGVVVLATGIAVVVSSMQRRTRYLGLMMEISGLAMAVISAWAPGMTPLISFGMLAVGGLMILNGAIMQRKTPEMPPSV